MLAAQGQLLCPILVSFYQQQLSQMQAQLGTIPDMALEVMIEDELIREKAEEENIVVTLQDAQAAINEELQQALTQPQQTITGTETLVEPTPVSQADVDEFYSTILDNVRISKKSFEEIRRRELARSKVQEALADEVPTTGLVVHAQIIQTETEAEAIAAKKLVIWTCVTRDLYDYWSSWETVALP